ncbi:hypothetical protein BS47DRAFT_48797 [Hydnum rufescens UP504]|uniref:Uncharacterized protein n=1 Tax=Hydnum rufescens UP504 TaxID=1448309 RepID=A0A9P6A9W1_9AGAM|nr:hypothetical protein BS47DRAFT_48797 [Hydnum rufescens UP504]
MPRVWRGLKRNWKRELVGFLLIGLSVLLPYLVWLLDLDPIVASFLGGVWGGIMCALVTILVLLFRYSSDV